MRYLKKFEAVIMPDSIDDNSVVNSFQSAVEFGLKNNFDVVDYDDFYNSLSEKNKKTAPLDMEFHFLHYLIQIIKE